jgi:hypothetical protein
MKRVRELVQHNEIGVVYGDGVVVDIELRDRAMLGFSGNLAVKVIGPHPVFVNGFWLSDRHGVVQLCSTPYEQFKMWIGGDLDTQIRVAIRPEWLLEPLPVDSRSVGDVSELRDLLGEATLFFGSELDSVDLIQCPDSWFHVLDDFASTGFPIAICGARNTGKSTFAKFLTNSLLNSREEVLFIDTDLGQNFLTPPGFVSAKLVKKPIFGHQVDIASNFSPLSIYIGHISPSSAPLVYLNALRALQTQLSHVFDLENLPVVLNTHGWITGLGSQLLEQMLNVFSCSRVVLLEESKSVENSEFLSFLEESGKQIFRVLSFKNSQTISKDKLTASNIRQLAYASYFVGQSLVSEIDLINLPESCLQTRWRIGFDRLVVYFVTTQVILIIFVISDSLV